MTHLEPDDQGSPRKKKKKKKVAKDKVVVQVKVDERRWWDTLWYGIKRYFRLK